MVCAKATCSDAATGMVVVSSQLTPFEPSSMSSVPAWSAKTLKRIVE
jgi:hypothetical protein